MSWFLSLRRSRTRIDLAVGMAGVRLGERVLQVGVGHPRVFALVSSKAGLTGRACAVVESAGDRATLERAAAGQGALVEVTAAPAGTWPFERGSFDLAIVDANALLGASTEVRMARLASAVDVVRPGGRILAIDRTPRSLGTLLGFERTPHQPGPRARSLLACLEEAGCRPARVLAEREGFAFVEGFRPNPTVI